VEELLTTEELSLRIKYDVRTIRENLKDSVLLEGVHYIRPFGGRKILFIWSAISRDIGRPLTRQDGSAIDRLLATRFASGSTSGTPVARPAEAANESPSPPTAQPPPEQTGRRALLRLVA